MKNGTVDPKEGADKFAKELRNFVNDRQFFHGLSDDAVADILADLAGDMTADPESEVTSDEVARLIELPALNRFPA